MSDLLDQFRMETNFDGLIQVVAKGLYSEPGVFLREVLQNAHDSISRRRNSGSDVQGRIDVRVDHDEGIIMVSDNGIGMDRKDIRQFLSTIGSSGTAEASKEFDAAGGKAHELIGQFGIGLLSTFLVADLVTVTTRKEGSPDAFRWTNSGSIECEIYSAVRSGCGTDIAIHINQKHAFLLDERRVQDLVIRYCDFLPFEIFINRDGPVNSVRAPWDRTKWSSNDERDAAYAAMIRRRYREDALDIIPVSLDEPFHARGVLYISDRHIPDVNTSGVVDVFVRRMFVRGDDNTLLPKWAKFVRGLIDSNDLEPTTARDNIKRVDHPAFESIQHHLGELLIRRLLYLADHDQTKFARICQWHRYHLKAMACYHQEFFNKVADLLSFETNKGPCVLRDYVKKNPARADYGGKAPIYYFTHRGSAAQFFGLADARGWTVIDASVWFDEQLLERYARAHEGSLQLQKLDNTDDPSLFAPLDPNRKAQFASLETDLENIIRRAGIPAVEVRTRDFQPDILPAVLLMSTEAEDDLRLRQAISEEWFQMEMRDLAEENAARMPRRSAMLVLNGTNRLVSDLNAADRRSTITQDILLGLYNSAVLYSQQLRSNTNAAPIHAQLTGLLQEMHALQGRYEDSVKQIETQRMELMSLRQRQQEAVNERPEHIRLFMIAPFADNYRGLEKAVRRLFERPPFFFEVQLGRDFTHDSCVFHNIWNHIRKAHGFVAEITELNPNVMYELGAVMMPGDERPVLMVCRSGVDLRLSDLKDNVFATYEDLNAPSERLEAQLRLAYERDGKIVHEGIRRLLRQRKKHFLSSTLLEGMRVRLNEKEIGLLCGKFPTVEELLLAGASTIATSFSLARFVIDAVIEELKGLISRPS